MKRILRIVLTIFHARTLTLNFRSMKAGFVALVGSAIYCPVANAGLVAYGIDYTVEYLGTQDMMGFDSIGAQLEIATSVFSQSMTQFLQATV